jgi:hypothetical protein
MELFPHWCAGVGSGEHASQVLGRGRVQIIRMKCKFSMGLSLACPFLSSTHFPPWMRQKGLVDLAWGVPFTQVGQGSVRSSPCTLGVYYGEHSGHIYYFSSL